MSSRHSGSIPRLPQTERDNGENKKNFKKKVLNRRAPPGGRCQQAAVGKGSSQKYTKDSQKMGKKIDGQMHDHFKYRKNKVEYTIGEEKYLKDAKIRRLAKTCSCLLSRRQTLIELFCSFQFIESELLLKHTNIRIQVNQNNGIQLVTKKQTINFSI